MKYLNPSRPPSDDGSGDTFTSLQQGKHLDRADGMCLMEAVSVAAGLSWSDTPPCTNPTLSLLARLVNDGVSGHVRGQLVTFVPALVRASDPSLATDWKVVETICRVTATRRSARRAETTRRWMTAARVVQATPLHGAFAWMVRHGAARRAVEACVEDAFIGGDRRAEVRLQEMMRAALEVQGTLPRDSRPTDLPVSPAKHAVD